MVSVGLSRLSSKAAEHSACYDMSYSDQQDATAQTRPFCTLQTFNNIFLYGHFNIILPSTATSPKCSNHIKFPNYNLSAFLVSPCLLHAHLFTSPPFTPLQQHDAKCTNYDVTSNTHVFRHATPCRWRFVRVKHDRTVNCLTRKTKAPQLTQRKSVTSHKACIFSDSAVRTSYLA